LGAKQGRGSPLTFGKIMKTISTILSFLIGLTIISGCASAKPPSPEWISGEWLPQTKETKMLRALKPEEATPEDEKYVKDPMLILQQIEMFQHCHLIIKGDKISYFFDAGNKYNRTVNFKIEDVKDDEINIFIPKDGEHWRLKKGETESVILLQFGPQKVMQLPLKKK
jgi:hypothetical protein